MERITVASLSQSEQSYKAAIELFEMRCRSCNLSPRTIEWYRMILDGLAAFMSSLPETPNPRTTKPYHLRAYLDHLQGKITRTGHRVAPGSIKRFHICLKTVFRFWKDEQIITQDPMALIEAPKAPRVIIRPLSSEQITAVLAQFNTKQFTGLRDWTMTLLLIDSGLRLSEMLGIKNQDIDWSENAIHVMGKGARERVVNFGAKAKKALWDYKQRRGNLQGVDFFFVDQFGRQIKKRWYQQVLARAGQRAKIEGVRVSPHTLRHTFGTQYILNGGDAASLKALLGHSSMETVTIYVNLANKDTAKLHRRYSPLDNMDSIPGAVQRVRLK